MSIINCGVYICPALVSALPLHAQITKTCLYNFDALKPTFYVVKLVFTGVYIIFLISAQKHRLWVLVRTASCVEAVLTSTHDTIQKHRLWVFIRTASSGGSGEYSQSMFWAEIWKISESFIWKFSFLVVKFSLDLNRHVFVTVVFLMTIRRWFSCCTSSLFGRRFHMWQFFCGWLAEYIAARFSCACLTLNFVKG